jgi:hypothetical protein
MRDDLTLLIPRLPRFTYVRPQALWLTLAVCFGAGYLIAQAVYVIRRAVGI